MSSIVDQLLRESGFELRRSKKHKVYRREDGKTFVQASTPSDVRAEHKSLAVLCRLLGVKKAEALQSLRRRKKPREADVETWLSQGPVIKDASAVPTAPQQIALSKEDRRLAKRIERIERNETAKRAKFASRWQEFMKRNAILHFPTNQFVFVKEPDLKRALADFVQGADEGTIARAVSDGHESECEPELLIHEAGEDSLTLVFADCSSLSGRLTRAPERTSRSSKMVLRRS